MTSAAVHAHKGDYAKAAKRARVYTPQIIANGRKAIVGARRAQLGPAL